MSMKPRAFRVRNFLAALSLAMFFSSAVGAQEKKDKAEEKKKSSVHAVVGATVLPVSGPMVSKRRVLLFRCGPMCICIAQPFCA